MKEQLTLLEENILSEAKADNDKLIAHVGQKEFDRFISLKDRLKGEEKDLYYWLKKEPEELTKALDNLEATPTRSQIDKEAGKGADLIAENDYYKVYKINTFDAAKKYGANTKWCITGKESGWIKNSKENKYWKQYTEKGIEFYFFISKKDNHKYAIASHPDRRVDFEIFDELDKRVEDIPNAPLVEGIYTPTVEINGIKIRDTAVIGANEDIREAIIPDGVTSIGNYAFYECKNLTSVTIPDSVTSIGYEAFSYCFGLTSIVIPNSVTSVGEYAFRGCTSLASIAIPDRVTIIADSAFRSCTSLKNVTIPDSVTYIGYAAFYNCTNLVSVTIPDSVKSIGKYAFEGCTSLTSITYQGMTEQWDSILKGSYWNRNAGNYTIHCTDGDIKKGDTSESLNESKADNGKLINHVGEEEANRFFKLKDRLKSQERDLYYWLKKDPQELTKALDNLEEIPTRSQKDTEAKQGAELIAENNYYKVYKISTFEAAKKYGANTKWCITGKQSGWDPGENENKYWKQYTDEGIEFYFYISKDGEHKYAIASHPDRRGQLEIFDEKDTKVDEIPNGPEIDNVYSNPYDENGLHIVDNRLIKVAEYATSVAIPDSVTSIRMDAFHNCTTLTSVTIPESVTSIGEHAFSGCTSLTTITIPNSVTNIGYRAFEGCASLTSVTIPDSVTYIGEYAFCNCTSLTNVTIGNNVTSIGWGTFYRCRSLTNVIIGNSVTLIEDEAFAGCSKLTNITYQGTKAQWGTVNKRYHWDLATGEYIVHCTDGDIGEEGTNESLREPSINTGKTNISLNEVYPNKGESKEDFIDRFMSATKDEYPDTKQRFAVANSYWDRREKKEEAMEEKELLTMEEPIEVDTSEQKIGISSLLSDLIKAQWDIVDQYNSAIVTLRYEDEERYADAINELESVVLDETANIGILEGIMQKVNPEFLIDDAKEETEERVTLEFPED